MHNLIAQLDSQTDTTWVCARCGMTVSCTAKDWKVCPNCYTPFTGPQPLLVGAVYRSEAGFLCVDINGVQRKLCRLARGGLIEFYDKRFDAHVLVDLKTLLDLTSA